MPEAVPLSPADVAAVVVTYHPDVTATGALVSALVDQVGTLLVVDNGSPEPELTGLRGVVENAGATLVTLGANLGIGEAQNVGIRLARERGAGAVLLSDQDSLPAPDMVRRLLDGLARATAEAEDGSRLRPAAVGPVTIDERNPGAALLFSDHRWGPRRAILPPTEGALVPATFLIASGCLIPLAAIDTVGAMNSSWFIDHIDLEWGLRATRAGLGLYGVVGAQLEHSLGDRTQRIPGRRRDVHIHSPLRNYYMVRNTVLLIRSGLLRSAWRWGYAGWITKYAVFYVLAVPPRLRRAGLMARALVHGLGGRTGALR